MYQSKDAKYYVAIDLGATSGRVTLCKVDGNGIDLDVVHRFPNNLIKMQGHCYWDIYDIYQNIITGLSHIATRGFKIESIGVDTWGVDVVMIGADGNLLSAPFAYRDQHWDGASELLFKRFPKQKLYELTGIQVMDINTIFQLDAMRRNGCSVLESASKILFMPDAISYLLTGEMVTEYTIATTGALVNAYNRRLEPQLLELVGLDVDKFGRMVYPGDQIGCLTAEIQKQTGLGPVPVIAVAGHDTASAVAAVPANGNNFAYLSSGTWSLMGIEVSKPIIDEESYKLDFTNEGGANGKITFLKNICGMWILERCRQEWADADYAVLIEEAQEAKPFGSFINPNDKCFANPKSMLDAISDYCRNTRQSEPKTRGEIVRCIFESLALRYRQAMDDLKRLSPFEITTLHIIGGGSQNAFLNQLTADALGLPVVAGPAECTAIGNVMIQAGLARDEVSGNVHTHLYEPNGNKDWNIAYDKFSKLNINYECD